MILRVELSAQRIPVTIKSCRTPADIFYFRTLHDILKYNKDEIKFINSGVRIFSRTEAKVDAPYRITQEGVNTMKSFCRKQNVTTSSLKDIEILLSYEYPDMEKLR